MSIEVRPVRDDELPAFIETMSTGFMERPDVDKVAAEVRPIWDLERTWAAFDDGRICGTFRSWATDVTVPGGKQLPAAAMPGVTVLPTHRRRGILRRMVAAEHGAARARGEAVGLLYASEYPIYGRFGYGPGSARRRGRSTPAGPGSTAIQRCHRVRQAGRGRGRCDEARV